MVSTEDEGDARRDESLLAGAGSWHGVPDRVDDILISPAKQSAVEKNRIGSDLLNGLVSYCRDLFRGKPIQITKRCIIITRMAKIRNASKDWSITSSPE